MKKGIVEKVKEYCIDFYENILKKQMGKNFLIVFGIILAIAVPEAVLLSSNVNEFENLQVTSKNISIRYDLLSEMIAVGLIIISSTVPYMYSTYLAIPMLSILIGIEISLLKGTSPLLILLFIVFKCAAYALAIVLGGILCKKITISFKKTSVKNDIFINTQRELLLCFNDKKGKEKIDRINKKIKEKMEKLEKEDESIILNFQVITVTSAIVFACVGISVMLKYI